MNTRQKKAKMGRYRAQQPNATLPGAKSGQGPDWMKGMDQDEYDAWAAGMGKYAKSLRGEEE